MKFRSKQFRIAAANAKGNQRAGITKHGRSHGMRELICKLIYEAKMQRKFARLGKKRGERIRTERLKFVDMHEEGDTLMRGSCAALHSYELQMRDEQRAQEI